MILVSAGGILANSLSESIPEFILEDSLGNPAILSSVGARLLINMKEAGAKGLNEGMGSSVSRSTVSEMNFEAHPAQTSAGSHIDVEEGLGIVEEIETVEV